MAVFFLAGQQEAGAKSNYKCEVVKLFLQSGAAAASPDI